MSTIQQRVASRYLAEKKAMIVRPIGEDQPWGWTNQSVRRERRLHLIPMDPVRRRRATIYLADEYGTKGVWTKGDDLGGETMVVAEWATRDANRIELENLWVDALFAMGFLCVDHLSQDLVVHCGHLKERRVPLGHFEPSSLKSWTIEGESRCLCQRYPLRALIWRDEDADVPF